jgi:hypothetical protein
VVDTNLWLFSFRPINPKIRWGCLRDIVQHICLNVDGKFVLRPEKAAEWMELQDLLILVGSLMKNKSSYLLGPSLALITPSYLGFSLSFNTPRAAHL